MRKVDISHGSIFCPLFAHLRRKLPVQHSGEPGQPDQGKDWSKHARTPCAWIGGHLPIGGFRIL